MPYSILSDDTKQQLQQERSRLTHDRDTIIVAVTQEVTQALDQLMVHIDTLLGHETSPNGKTTADASASETSEATGESLALAPKSQSRKRSPKSTAKPQASVKAKQPVKQFDAKQLQGEFQGMNASDAILQLMQQQSERSFTTDELIQALYGAIAPSELPTARKSVAAVLMQGGRKGRFIKGSGNPAPYRLQESAMK